MAWFQDTLSVDHRIYLNLLVFLGFIVAAFVPASSWAKKLRGDETPTDVASKSIGVMPGR